MRNSRLGYFTDGGGRHRPDGPGRGEGARGDAGSKPDDVVRIYRERAGRGGKTVTLVRGLPDRGPALEARAAELKRLCGAGGTVKDGAIEIQGDHRERVAPPPMPLPPP